MTHTEATARCWAEIDLNEICGNYRRAREITNPNAEIICVLKANAYGMGAPAVCKALMTCGAKTFAVASGDEAEELLAACPDADVLVLGLTGEEQAARLIAKRAIFTLFSHDQGMMLARAAKAAGVSARVHVKAETGLYRLGFFGPDAPDQIESLRATGLFSMEGLYTHLALHNPESDAKQLQKFLAFRDALAERDIHFNLVHALDSIGMVRYPEYHLDAVRIGAWLYGVVPGGYPNENGECRVPARLVTRVAQLRRVAAGEYLGYDEDHPLARDAVIATLSAGYADGYPRLNSVGEVGIRGQRAPVAGLVCMDQTTVDVTAVPGVRPGDEVTLLGGGIGLDEVAGWAGTNRNDLLSRIGRRVPRVYLRGGEVEEIRMEVGGLC